MPKLLVLNNTRVSFQRLSDAKFISGWVRSITPQAVIVHSFTDARPEAGNEFAFHVFGSGLEAFFKGEAIRVQRADPGLFLFKGRMPGFALEMECRICGEMTFKDSRALPRFFVTGFTGKVRCGDSSAPLEVVLIDIGPEGFSFFAGAPLRKGDRLEAVVSGNGQTMNLFGEVRNCIACGPEGAFHRVGVRLIEMSRIDGQKWRSVYSAIVEESQMTQTEKRTRNPLLGQTKNPAA